MILPYAMFYARYLPRRPDAVLENLARQNLGCLERRVMCTAEDEDELLRAAQDTLDAITMPGYKFYPILKRLDEAVRKANDRLATAKRLEKAGLIPSSQSETYEED